MLYARLIGNRHTPWLLVGTFSLIGGLLLVILLVFIFGCGLNYSSLGYQPTCYAPPSYGYLLLDNSPQTTGYFKAQWPKGLIARQKLAWPMVRRFSAGERLDPALVMAVVQVESCFDPNVVSHRGATGLMQINPRTARHLGLKNPMDPEANLKAGIKYLGSLQKMFNNDIQLMLAAYNAGPGRVQAAGGVVPPIKETQDFVEKVLAYRDTFRSRFN